MWERALRAVENGTAMRVEVSPGSTRDSWAGFDPWRVAVKIRLKANPVGGKANEALMRFIAEGLGTKPNAVRLLSGHSSRIKEVLVASVDVETVSSRLTEVLGR